jgi:hypothetical protein
VSIRELIDTLREQPEAKREANNREKSVVNIHALKSRHTLLLGGTRAREPRTKTRYLVANTPERYPHTCSWRWSGAHATHPREIFRLLCIGSPLLAASFRQYMQCKMPGCLACGPSQIKSDSDTDKTRLKTRLRLFQTSGKLIRVDLAGAPSLDGLQLLYA